MYNKDKMSDFYDYDLTEEDIIKILALLNSINGEINALSFNTIINNRPKFQTESLLNMFGVGNLKTALKI